MIILNENFKYVLKLISCVLNNKKPCPIPKNCDADKIVNIAIAHSVGALVFSGFEQIKDSIDEKAYKKLENYNNKMIQREILQQVDVEALSELLNENEIKFVLLKGYVIKKLFLSPHYRESCDVDILFDTAKEKKVNEIMLSLGYDKSEDSPCHKDYIKSSMLHIEMHRKLMQEGYYGYDYFNKIWDKVTRKENSKYEYIMKDEDYYLFMISHLAKHYFTGGAGLKLFIDIYLFNKAYKEKLDLNYIYSELDKIKLKGFAKNMEKLSFALFENQELNEDQLIMANFIYECGTFGKKENIDISNIIKSQKSKKYNKMKFISLIKRVFLKYSIMKTMYPTLEKAPFLLPFYWVRRWFERIFLDTSRVKREFNDIKNFDNEKLEKMQYIHYISEKE